MEILPSSCAPGKSNTCWKSLWIVLEWASFCHIRPGDASGRWRLPHLSLKRFFSWFCSHGLSNDFFLLIHTFPGSADIMRGRCLAWRFGQPCVFPSQSLGGDLGVAPQMFFFEQSTIQQKDGILTFSHHPNSHPSINSRMANKCGMMGCHSDHSSPVQVKVNPWFAISLCLYELTRQLDWEERRGSLKCIGGFLAATDPGGNRCWNISKKHGDFIETPLERIESISRKPSKTAEV